jgi:hypothetical protein
MYLTYSSLRAKDVIVRPSTPLPLSEQIQVIFCRFSVVGMIIALSLPLSLSLKHLNYLYCSWPYTRLGPWFLIITSSSARGLEMRLLPSHFKLF